jgi:hypothetical protein
VHADPGPCAIKRLCIKRLCIKRLCIKRLCMNTLPTRPGRAIGYLGAMTTPSIPGPTCAPTTAPTSPTCQVVEAGEPVPQPPGKSLARTALARCCTATSTCLLPARATAISSSRASALAEVRTFSSSSTRPSDQVQERLHRERPEPTSAAAAPIRPPRRRCSRRST